MPTPAAKPVGRMPTYSATRCGRKDIEIEMSPSMSSRRSPASLTASAAASAARPSADRWGHERLCAVSPMPTMAVFPRKLIPYLPPWCSPVVHLCYHGNGHALSGTDHGFGQTPLQHVSDILFFPGRFGPTEKSYTDTNYANYAITPHWNVSLTE